MFSKSFKPYNVSAKKWECPNCYIVNDKDKNAAQKRFR